MFLYIYVHSYTITLNSPTHCLFKHNNVISPVSPNTPHRRVIYSNHFINHISFNFQITFPPHSRPHTFLYLWYPSPYFYTVNEIPLHQIPTHHAWEFGKVCSLLLTIGHTGLKFAHFLSDFVLYNIPSLFMTPGPNLRFLWFLWTLGIWGAWCKVDYYVIRQQESIRTTPRGAQDKQPLALTWCELP